MKIVHDKISIQELEQMAEKMFGGIVKAVVDIEKKIMAVDAEMHADEEARLLEEGSEQENLWGINILPDQFKKNGDYIIFDSMINLRPSQGNRTRSVEDEQTRKKIKKIVDKLIVS